MATTSIQSGQLGHYTWVIDEILLEEAKSNQGEPSTYLRPFEVVQNANGIQISALSESASEELISLLAQLVGISYNIPSFSSNKNLQFERLENDNVEKNVRRIKSSLITLENSNFVKQYIDGPPPEVFSPDPTK